VKSPRGKINPITGEVTVITTLSPNSVIEGWLERLEQTLGEDFGWRRIGDVAPTPASIAEPRPARIRSAQTRSQISPEQSLHAQRLMTSRDFGPLLAEGLAERLVASPSHWDGRVEVPDAELGRLRLVVTEFEKYPMDGAPERNSPTKTRTGRRIVFVEHVPLD